MTDNKNYVMEVEILEEAGYESALFGLSLNKKQTKDMTSVAKRLAPMDDGHNKFLEHIELWLKVKAPRYWWQEADTYRLSSKSSESTMHTLEKELSVYKSFGEIKPLFEYDGISIEQWQLLLLAVYSDDKEERLVAIKKNLPESFLQTRMWKMSYKTLRNIIKQRSTHRLPHWRDFCTKVYDQCEHKEYLNDLYPFSGDKGETIL